MLTHLIVVDDTVFASIEGSLCLEELSPDGIVHDDRVVDINGDAQDSTLLRQTACGTGRLLGPQGLAVC
jgi:hypothetical protein